MALRLYSGDAFPNIALTLANGGSMELPSAIDSRFLIAIFYRGHW